VVPARGGEGNQGHLQCRRLSHEQTTRIREIGEQLRKFVGMGSAFASRRERLVVQPVTVNPEEDGWRA